MEECQRIDNYDNFITVLLNYKASIMKSAHKTLLNLNYILTHKIRAF